MLFLTENLGFFQFFSFFFGFLRFFGFFQFVSKQFVLVILLLYRNRVSMFRLNRNKQKTHPNSLKESIFAYFSENLWLIRFVSVCYETVLFVFGFMIQTETNARQMLFRFVSVRTEISFLFVSRTPYARRFALQYPAAKSHQASITFFLLWLSPDDSCSDQSGPPQT